MSPEKLKEIEQRYLENGDALDASSYCVLDLIHEVRALRIDNSRTNQWSDSHPRRPQRRTQVRDIQQDVREFMAAFKQEMHDTPQWPDHDTMDLRLRLKAEEFCEWLRDSGYDFTIDITRLFGVERIKVFRSMEWESQQSLPKSADALIDDLYVTVGALLAMGIDFWPLWDAVHAANMAKAGGPVVNGKQMKPEGWKAPDIEALLREQRWSE